MMKTQPLSRKEFLRMAGIAALGAAASACRGALPAASPTLPAGSTASPTPVLPTATAVPPTPIPPPGEITISGGNADYWAGEAPVAGLLKNLEDCQSVAIRVNGVEIEAAHSGDNFSATIPLSPGTNRVTAVCRRSNGSEETSQMVEITGRLRNTPVASIQVALDGNLLTLDSSGSTPAPVSADQDTQPQIMRRTWSARAGNPAPATLKGIALLADREFTGEASGETLEVILPEVDGEYYFNLRVEDEAGRADSSATYVVVEQGQAHIPNYDTENPAWVETAIVYGVIPRNFGSPAFEAVTGKLDYLKDLGVNALWLAPVNVSPPGDYGYAVVDYFNLNPRYGTKEDFQRMIQEAHARGIRVLMDFVPNHSSAQHPYYLDAVVNREASRYWDFYDRDESGHTTHYFDWKHLPNLNYNNPEVVAWMIEAFSYWVREFDVDGFRVDVAWGVKERKPEFWPMWRRELKRIKPDLLLLAEASARDPYYFDNGYDAAYDWTDQLGKWAWELAWDSYQNTLLAYNLHTVLTNRPEGYHPDALIFRFLNNNDTGDRFITRHGEGITRVATAMLLTLPGIPCIYTADEVGAWFRPYFDATALSWREKYPGLIDYHKKLIAMRKQIPSLHSRFWTPVEITSSQSAAYAYLRHPDPAVADLPDQPVLVVLNYHEEPVEVDLELPESFQGLAAQGRLYDVLADEQVATARAGTGIRLALPASTARVLVQRKPS